MILFDWRLWFFILELAVIPPLMRFSLRWGMLGGHYDKELDYITHYVNKTAWKTARSGTQMGGKAMKRVQMAIDDGFTDGILRNIMPYLKVLGVDDLIEDIENPQAIMEIIAQNIHRFPNAWALLENLIRGRVPNLSKENVDTSQQEGW